MIILKKPTKEEKEFYTVPPKEPVEAYPRYVKHIDIVRAMMLEKGTLKEEDILYESSENTFRVIKEKDIMKVESFNDFLKRKENEDDK